MGGRFRCWGGNLGVHDPLPSSGGSLGAWSTLVGGDCAFRQIAERSMLSAFRFHVKRIETLPMVSLFFRLVSVFVSIKQDISLNLVSFVDPGRKPLTAFFVCDSLSGSLMSEMANKDIKPIISTLWAVRLVRPHRSERKSVRVSRKGLPNGTPAAILWLGGAKSEFSSTRSEA